MVAKILDGKQIAKDYRQGLQDQVEALKEKGFTPKLSVILVGNDGASQSYVRSKKKAAEKIGMISPINIGKLYIDEQTFVPCTPLGIMEILKHADIDLEGKNAVVIGRSHIVGQPVSKLLLQKNASVTILHSRSKDMTSYLKDADVIVSAVGKPGLVTKDVVKEGAVIIDVGNTPDENGKLKGDVDYDAVKEIAGAITPVPGGVGPLTITMVLRPQHRSCDYDKVLPHN
ncbi:tetrahydrofolate dehydrogenase/cyclohydrolase catalytic domain-containing protein [Staphylococcus aureus]